MDRIFGSGSSKVTMKTLTDFSQLSSSTKSHLKNVYTCLTLCTLSAAAGAYVHVGLGIMKGGFLSVIASLALMVWLAATPHAKENQTKRLLILSGFGGTVGLGMGPLLEAVIDINPQIILTSFLLSTVIFASFSICALYAQRRSMLFLGGPLMSMLNVMILVSLFNIFLGSFSISYAMVFMGIFLFSGFILYDTQLIVEKHIHGDNDYVWHSVDLFLDLVNLFKRIMILLASKEKKKE